MALMQHLIQAVYNADVSGYTIVRIESGPTEGVCLGSNDDSSAVKPYAVWKVGPTGALVNQKKWDTLDEALTDYTARRDTAL